MGKIKKIQLGDLIEFQRGYDLPKDSFIEGTYPVVSSNGILGFHNEYKVKGPGITIGRSGTVGIPQYIGSDFFPHNTSLFIKNFKGNNIKYIFYLLKELGLNSKKSGSGVPTMNRNHLHPLKINAYTCVQTQQKIAAVLSALDEKIELNNKINAELEAMAKLIYDYWFVQFDFPSDLAPQPPKGGVESNNFNSSFEDGENQGQTPRVLNSADKALYEKLSLKAKEMRYNPTKAEAILWGKLSDKKLFQCKFRRQHIISSYIVDFYCVEKNLIIEVDGEIHDSQIEEDNLRQENLEALGCQFLRFTNNEVLEDLENVINKIQIFLTKPSQQTKTPPLGGWGAPYKSSGGEMVWSDELKREIPNGWEVKKLGEIENNIITGKTPPTGESTFHGGNIPFITIPDIRGSMHIVDTQVKLTQKGADFQRNKYIPKDSLCVSCIASPGLIGFTVQISQTNQQINSIICECTENKNYLYFALNDYFKFAKGAKTGNTFANMNKGDFESIKII